MLAIPAGEGGGAEGEPDKDRLVGPSIRQDRGLQNLWQQRKGMINKT